MRLFVGIDLSTVTEELSSLQKEFNQVIDGRLVKENQFHITLEFLGEYNPYKAVKKLDKIKFQKFTFTTNNLGVFPHANDPKILWLGVKEELIFEKLNKKIRKQLRINSGKKYHAHITLARIKKINDKEKFIDLLNKKRKEITLEVKSFNLCSSTITQKGAIHTIIKEYELS